MTKKNAQECLSQVSFMDAFVRCLGVVFQPVVGGLLVDIRHHRGKID